MRCSAAAAGLFGSFFSCRPGARCRRRRRLAVVAPASWPRRRRARGHRAIAVVTFLVGGAAASLLRPASCPMPSAAAAAAPIAGFLLRCLVAHARRCAACLPCPLAHRLAVQHRLFPPRRAAHLVPSAASVVRVVVLVPRGEFILDGAAELGAGLERTPRPPLPPRPCRGLRLRTDPWRSVPSRAVSASVAGADAARSPRRHL